VFPAAPDVPPDRVRLPPFEEPEPLPPRTSRSEPGVAPDGTSQPPTVPAMPDAPTEIPAFVVLVPFTWRLKPVAFVFVPTRIMPFTARMLVPFVHVKFEDAPNAPELLNWICVFAPLGVPDDAALFTQFVPLNDRTCPLAGDVSTTSDSASSTAAAIRASARVFVKYRFVPSAMFVDVSVTAPVSEFTLVTGADGAAVFTQFVPLNDKIWPLAGEVNTTSARLSSTAAAIRASARAFVKYRFVPSAMFVVVKTTVPVCEFTLVTGADGGTVFTQLVPLNVRI